MASRKVRKPATVATWLGADKPVGTEVIVLFVPSRDRDGSAIAQDDWVTRGLEVLGTLFRGATAYPRARGVWRDDSRGGELLYEEPTVITCYADPSSVTEANFRRLRAFLHRLGRETHQGEVGLVVGDEYFGITEFDA